LFLSTSDIGADSVLYSNVTNEVGTTNTGYSTGGIAMNLALSGTTTVTADNSIADPVFHKSICRSSDASITKAAVTSVEL
jgi:hypothetical protein